MANTIQSLFPFTENRAKNFEVTPCYVQFAAPIVAGKYVFNTQLTPPVVFGQLPQTQVGVIAGIMISANCTPAAFAAAVDSPLLLQVIHGGNRTPVNLKPFAFSDFAQGDNYQDQFECSTTSINKEEKFLLGITGEVNQLTGMTNNELILNVCFNFIRADKKQFKG